MGFREIAAFVVLAAVWGASFLFMRIALPALGPFPLMALRVLLAAVLLYGVGVLFGEPLTTAARLPQIATLGAISAAAPFALWGIAELTLTAATGSIINATTPFFTALCARIWLGERLGRLSAIGAAIAFVGVIIVVGGASLALDRATIVSVCAAFFAAACYGAAGVYAKKAVPTVPSFSLAIGQKAAAGVLLLPVALIRLPRVLPSMNVVLAVLGIAILSTALAYLLYFYLLESVGPTMTQSVTFLVPVFGVLWGALFLHEGIGAPTLCGFAAILLGVAFLFKERGITAADRTKSVKL